MRKLLALLLAVCVWVGLAVQPAQAAFSFDVLTPCGQSEAFQKRLNDEISAFEDRLSNFQAGTPQYQYLQHKIETTKARFSKYANSSLLCGEDGLPHLISDGRWDHAGEFIIPSLLFLYIAGWIGWVGRSYLRAIRKDVDEAYTKEIIIDVPLALQCMLTGFIWPLAALQQFGSGELTAPDNEVPVSPR
ncbi:MAG: Photosystem I reaction center subunit III [Pseudanabaenaceae cyanobacterium]